MLFRYLKLAALILLVYGPSYSEITPFEYSLYTSDTTRSPIAIAYSLIGHEETKIQEFKDTEEHKVKEVKIKQHKPIIELGKHIARKTSQTTFKKIAQKKRIIKLVDYVAIGTGFTRPKIISTAMLNNTQMAQLQIVALGKRINNFISAELALNYSPEYYQKTVVLNVDYSSTYTSIIGFLNGHINLLSISDYSISPFIMGGLGLAYNTSQTFSSQLNVNSRSLTPIVNALEKQGKYSLATQLGFGVAFKLNKYLQLNISYRYIDRNKFTVNLFRSDNTAVSSQISEQATVVKLIMNF